MPCVLQETLLDRLEMQSRQSSSTPFLIPHGVFMVSELLRVTPTFFGTIITLIVLLWWLASSNFLIELARTDPRVAGTNNT